MKMIKVMTATATTMTMMMMLTKNENFYSLAIQSFRFKIAYKNTMLANKLSFSKETFTHSLTLAISIAPL